MHHISIIQLDQKQLSKLITETLRTELNEHFQSAGNSSEEYLTREETAQLLKITLSTLHSYTKKGTLKGYRLDGRVLYKRSEVEAAPKPIPISKYRRNRK